MINNGKYTPRWHGIDNPLPRVLFFFSKIFSKHQQWPTIARLNFVITRERATPLFIHFRRKLNFIQRVVQRNERYALGHNAVDGTLCDRVHRSSIRYKIWFSGCRVWRASNTKTYVNFSGGLLRTVYVRRRTTARRSRLFGDSVRPLTRRVSPGWRALWRPVRTSRGKRHRQSWRGKQRSVTSHTPHYGISYACSCDGTISRETTWRQNAKLNACVSTSSRRDFFSRSRRTWLYRQESVGFFLFRFIRT